MRKFIPISTFDTLYGNSSDLLTEDGMKRFQNRVVSEGWTIAESNGFSQSDFQVFLASTAHPSAVVFHGWVARYPSLLQGISGGKFTAPFADEKRFLEHQLAEQFQHFISPYLSHALLSINDSVPENLELYLSHTALLDEDHRATVEEQLFKPIKEKLVALEKLAMEEEDEQALVEATHPLCDPSVIRSVNHLSKASYALKLSYVDSVLSALHSRACTLRLANWILKQMETVSLNKEHEYKLTDLRRELKTGRLKVRNQGKSGIQVTGRAIWTGFVIIFLGGFAFWVLYFQPFNSIDDPDMAGENSFKKFSIGERKKLDSLIRDMQGDFRNRLNPIDPGSQMSPGGGAVFSLRTSFENALMERIYQNLSLDAELKYNYPIDSCPGTNNLSGFKRHTEVQDLSKRKAFREMMVRNESDYDVLMYVSVNEHDGDVYSLLIRSGETKTVELHVLDVIVFVAGNDYQPFYAPNGCKPEEMPTSDFKYHFCSTDHNYEESFNMPYRYDTPRPGVSKLMITGTNGTYFSVTDIHGVLEEYS